MKDYYYSLGIDPDSNEADIREALASKSGTGDCEAVLLDPKKRAVYDEVHSTLTAIATLRHRLGLDQDESWFVEHCSQFVIRLRRKKVPLPVAQSAPDDTADEMQGDTAVAAQEPEADSRSAQVPDQPGPSGRSTVIVIGVIVVAAITAMLALALR